MDLTLRAWGLGYPERRLSTVLAGTSSLLTVSSEGDEPIQEIPRPQPVPLAQALTRKCLQCGYPFKIKYKGQINKVCSKRCREARRLALAIERAQREAWIR